MQMNRKELEAFAKEAAKSIKTPENLNNFSRMLMKLPLRLYSTLRWKSIYAKTNMPSLFWSTPTEHFF
jgi:hypothetical protein